ncbi:CPBP family glutamic-type intramembrane protease [Kribbella sp. NPDC050281]|uniref:CPBP family glutamic-type intramembrane protease n=1 Tax=Kribbella sp. NPDC050281 TaxID=3155515 RepID=UPI0033EB26BF
MNAQTIEVEPAARRIAEQHRTRGPIGVIRRYPIISFVVLACFFGWLRYITAFLGLGSNPENLPLGPLAAALVVTACQGREELRAWGRRLRSWRAAPKWYLLAILAPVVLHTINVLVNHLLGAPLPTSEQLAAWPGVLASMVVLVVLIGIGEEAGWMAFAAPILLRRHGFLAAWALAAGMRILWHLPLMITGELPWVVGIVGNAAFTMVMLRVFVASGGRWTLTAVWHASLNAVGSGFFFLMVTGEDKARLGYLLVAAYTVVAIVVYFARRPARSSVT